MSKVNPFSSEQQKEKQKMDEKARTFSSLIIQWELHPSVEWRQWWIIEGKKLVMWNLVVSILVFDVFVDYVEDVFFVFVFSVNYWFS
jgi:hypothetical protein